MQEHFIMKATDLKEIISRLGLPYLAIQKQKFRITILAFSSRNSLKHSDDFQKQLLFCMIKDTYSRRSILLLFLY